MENHYINYRCRKCGQMISVESDNPLGIASTEFNRTLRPTKGLHNCTSEEGEIPFFDVVSLSNHPIKDAIIRKLHE